MFFGFIEILAVITILQLLTLSIFLFTYKKGKQLSNKILSAFLFFDALTIIEYLLYRFRELIYPDFPHIYYIAGTFVFIWGPLIYLYTKSLCYRNFALKKKDIVHFVPFFIFLIYMIFDFHIKSVDVKRELLIAEKVMDVWEKIIINSSLHLQILIYLIVSLLVLRVYRKEIKKFYSTLEHIKLSWLNFILIGFISLWILDLVYFILWRTIYSYLGEMLNIITLIVTFIFANIIVYKGLNYPEILSGIEPKPLRQKYENSPLSKLDKERYLKKLIFYMENEKPYLLPSLTIDELATKLKISARYLSQIINESLHKNFFDFINHYRIEETKRILSTPSNNGKTILQILLEVGFNSKAAFNRVFKKHTGMTPTEFKKVHQV